MYAKMVVVASLVTHVLLSGALKFARKVCYLISEATWKMCEKRMPMDHFLQCVKIRARQTQIVLMKMLAE